MFKTKKSHVIIALLVLVVFFVYVRFVKEIFQPLKNESVVAPTTNTPVPKTAAEQNAQALREVSAEVSYDTSGDYQDHLRFVVTLDKAGVIQKVMTLDAETGEVPEKKKEFNDQVNVILKGKKLSELKAIDKVGKSSLTTTAFNDALKELQSK